MSKDFSSKQIRVSQLIASGGISGKPNVGLVIYSGSRATDFAGTFPAAMLSDIGSDTFLFISGSKGTRQVTTGDRAGGIAVFGGDVVVSGTMYMEKLVAEVTSVTDSDHHISGSLIIENKNTGGPKTNINLGTSPATANQSIDISLALRGGGMASGEGAIAFDYVPGTEIADALIFESGGQLVISASNDMLFYAGGGGSFASFQFFANNVQGQTGQVFTVFSGSGAGASPKEDGTDVNFYVSGSKGLRGVGGSYGTAVFGGDMFVSGTFSTEDMTVEDDLTVGDDLLFSSDGARISFGVDQDVTLTHVHDEGLLLARALGALSSRKLMLGDEATFIHQQADGEIGIDADSVINITAPTVDIDASTEVNISGQATVAGTLLVAQDIQHSGDTDTKISFGTDSVVLYAGGMNCISLIEDGTGSGVVFNLTGLANLDFIVRSDNEDEAIFLDSGNDTLYINKGETAFTTVMGNTNDEAIRIDATGVVFNEDGHATNDFRVESDNQTHMLFVDSGIDAVGIGTSPDNGVTLQIADARDDSATVVYIENESASAYDPQVSFGLNAVVKHSIGVDDSDSDKFKIAMGSLLGASNKALLDLPSANHGEIVVNEDGLDIDFRVESNNNTHAIFVDAEKDLVSILSSSVGDIDSDVAFFVSGAVGQRQNAFQRSVSLFGGVLVASGGIFANTGGKNRIGLRVHGIGPTNLLEVNSLLNKVTVAGPAGDDTTVFEVKGNDDAGSSVASMFIVSPTGVGVNDGGGNVNFIVESQNKNRAFYVDAGNDKISFLSSSSGTTGGDGKDVAFFVSGTEGSGGSAIRGTALFGGDLVTSGVLRVHGSKVIGGVASSIILDHNGTSAIIWDSDVDVEYPDAAIAETSQTLILSGNRGVQVYGDDLTLGSNGYGTDFTSYGETSSRYLYWDASADKLTVYGSATFGFGETVFNENGSNYGHFRAETDNKTHAIYVDAALDKVSILSGSGVTGAKGPDVAFFVSGSVGSQGTAVRGTSLFGGDLVVSGGLYLEERAAPGAVVDGTIVLYGKDDGGVTKLYLKNESGEQEVAGGAVSAIANGSDNRIATFTSADALNGEANLTFDGTDFTLTGNANLSEYIYHAGDTDTFIRFQDDSITLSAGNESLVTITESSQDIVTIGDGGDVDFQVKTSNENNALFVQGSSDRVGIGTNAPGATLHVSDATPSIQIQRESNSNNASVEWLGQAGVRANMVHLGGGNDFVVSTWNSNVSAVHESLRFTDDRAVILLSGTNVMPSSMQPAMCSDVNFFVSGSINSHGTAVKGTAAFGGDVVVSGAMYFDERYGIAAVGTIADGTVAVYGRDDGGVTKLYYKNESGEVLIGGTGGAGAVASVTNASDNRVATFSASDALNGEANFTFDGTNVETMGNIYAAQVVTASMGLSGSLTRLADGTSFIAAGPGVTVQSASNGSITLGIADISNNLTIGPDADNTDRTITFGHATVKSVMGIDDDRDVFAINTDAAFETGNDLEINSSGVVSLANGGLNVYGGDITIGADADGTDRKITFGHTTLKSSIGIDDSSDVFAINTDVNFETGNDLEIDASGNVRIGNGDLRVDGGDIYGPDAGNLRLRSDNSIIVQLDEDQASAPSTSKFIVWDASETSKFEVDESGNVQMDGDVTIGGQDIKSSDGTTSLTLDNNGNVTVANNLVLGNNIVKNSDDEICLSVDADQNIAIHDKIIHLNDTNTMIRFPSTDQISMQAAGFEIINVDGSSAQKSVIINESQEDIDFRIESDNLTHLFFTDAGNNRIGIATDSPANSLQINHAGGDGGDGLMIVRAGSVTDTNLLGGIGFDSTDGNVPSTITEASAFIAAYAAENHGSLDKGADLVFGCTLIDDDDDTVSHEYMRILDSGKIGIGTSTPDGLVNIKNTSISALDDVGDPTNYHLQIQGSTTNNKSAGICLSSTDNNVGAAIIYKDLGSNAVGELQFYTKTSTTTQDDPVLTMTLNGDTVTIDAAEPKLKLHSDSNTDLHNGTLYFIKEDDAVGDDSELGVILFKSLITAGTERSSAAISVSSYGAHSDSDSAGELRFWITPDGGSTTLSEVVRIREGDNNMMFIDGNLSEDSLTFTEGHRYVEENSDIAMGDTCVLIDGKIQKSSAPKQKNVCGIAWFKVHQEREDMGFGNLAVTCDDNGLIRFKSSKDSLGVLHDRGEYVDDEIVITDAYSKLWKMASIGDSRQLSDDNSTQENLTGFKVCNEGGAIEAGDLLCTSSTAGYLMKQDDDIIHGYTVGKAMENVTFDGNGQASGVYGFIYCG